MGEDRLERLSGISHRSKARPQRQSQKLVRFHQGPYREPVEKTVFDDRENRSVDERGFPHREHSREVSLGAALYKRLKSLSRPAPTTTRAVGTPSQCGRSS